MTTPRTATFAVLFIALSACLPSPRRETQIVGGGGTGGTVGATTGGSMTPGSGPLDTLTQLNGFLAQQGYQRVGPFMHGASMPPNGVIAYPIDSQPGACYVAAAVATQGTDLNLIIVNPSGQDGGHDVAPDAHPAVNFCPTAQGRHISRLQMASGTGEYYYALFQGPGNQPANLAQFFGGAQEAGPQVAQMDPATMGRVEALDRALAGERFTRLTQPQGLILGTRQLREYPLNLEQGKCYAFATFGGPGATNTDLFLSSGATYLQADNTPAQDGLVRYCAPQTGQYTLEAQLYAGQGGVFVTVYAQGDAPTQQNVISTQSTAGAGLEENYHLLDADMRARGYEGYGEPARGSLDEGATRNFEIHLEGGKCYAILAVGDNGVRNLDIVLVNASGRDLDRDVETDARPVVRVCPQSTGDFNMQVRMASGGGNFIYAPYQWPRGTRGAGLSGLIFVRLSEVSSLLAVEEYAPDVDSDTGDGNLGRQGMTRTHTIQLAGNACYSIVVVGGDGVNDLGLSLKQGSTEIMTDGTRNAFPNVRTCTQAPGRYTLDIEAENGAGPYYYQVFRRGN